MPKGEVRFRLTAKGERATANKLKKVEKAFDDMHGGAKGFNSILRGMGPGFATATAAAAAFGAALYGLGRALNFIAERGAAFGGPAATFAQMADPSMLRRLQSLSAWQIRQVDLMRTYNQTMQVQLVNQEEFAEWTERITASAMSRGEAPAEMFRRMAEVLSGGGFEALRTMGVNIAEIQEAVQASGESMESLAGKSQALDLALVQLREIQGNVTNSVGNLTDAFTAASNNAQDYFDQAAQVVAESPALVAAFEEARGKLNNFGFTARSTGEIVAAVFRTIIVAMTHLVEQSSRLLQSYFSANARLIASIRDNPAFQWLVENIPGGESLNQMLNRLHDLMRGSQTIAGAWREGAEGVRAAVQGNELTGTGTPQQTPRLPRTPRSRDSGDEVDQDKVRLQKILSNREYYDEQIRERNMANAEVQRELHDKTMEQLRERHERELEYIDERVQWELESTATIQADRDRRFDKHVGQITSMSEGFASLGSTISQIIATNAENTEKARKVEGAFLIAYNSVMAATELAEAIRSFAKQRYGSGALHLVSMAKYIAAAALAGSRLGGGSASASSGTAYRPVDKDTSKPKEDKDSGITIYQQYTLSRTEAGMGQLMERAQYKREQTGLYSGRTEGIHFGS